MRLTNRLLAVAASAGAGLLLSQAVSCGAAAPGSEIYRHPPRAQLQQAEQLFGRLLAGEYGTEVRAAARELGFRWTEDDTSAILLDEGKTGQGEYHFSKQPGAAIALQAPHRFHDRYTGTIARRLFQQTGFASIAMNSLPRGTAVQGNAAVTADLARLQHSFHTAFSGAFARRFPDGQLVQLHGFSAAKRRSPQARLADIILSTGSPENSIYLLHLQDCLVSRGWQTLRYPQQVGELGATRNSIGALLRSMGHQGFTHVEMNLETRQQLLADAQLLRDFAGCLSGVQR